MSPKYIISLLVVFLASNSFAFTTGNLMYSFDFDRDPGGGNPLIYTYGSSNASLLNASHISYTPASLTWQPSGGVAGSGYIRTKAVKADSLKITLPVNRSVTSTDFTISFNIRNYSGNGNAIFTINGATVNNYWDIWGVGGGSSSWKDENGNASSPPPVNKTANWQSVVYAIKNRTATLYIDGKNRGTFTFANNFANSPNLIVLGLGMSGTNANNTIEADFDNIAIWNKAVTTEEEAKAIASANTPSTILGNTEKQAGPLYKRVWNHNAEDGWSYFHHGGGSDTNPEPKIVFKDGFLNITLLKDSTQRRKACVSPGSTTGRYKWRVCIPERDGNSRASVGAFIYNNDYCEIDFEIAAGTPSERTKWGVKEDEVVALMTSQANPNFSEAVPLKPGWHTLELDLTDKNGKLYVEWSIDGQRRKFLQTNLDSTTKFSIWSSVEVLTGFGTHSPTKNITVSFDRMEYYFHP